MEENFKFIKPGEVRTRIAPSPTGFLHIGTARTALFNYIFAKQHQGNFILRIEDTDLERSDPEFEKDIIENLKWLGLEWDEGPEVGGEYGPYRQTEKIEVYAKYLKKLLDEDKAYYCFCSEEELETQRQYQMSMSKQPKYNGKCSEMSKEEAEKHITEGSPAIIRFRTVSKKVHFTDLIRGKLEFDTSLLGDMVIAKNLTTPLYNFAVVVDDFEMKISHVIRGEDHLSNTQKQILIQEALEFNQPQYAHVPLILGSDRSKLSKRHSAVSINSYRKDGYLPETMINFMAFLGWNPGDEREIYSLPSLVKEFSLEKVQKGGAIFNVKKLDFLNGFYIRQKSAEKLTELCLPYLLETGLIEKNGHALNQAENLEMFKENKIESTEYKITETKEGISLTDLKKIIVSYQERIKKLSEISELTDFFFKEKVDCNENLLKWKNISNEDIKNSLNELEKILSKINITDWNKENLESIIMPIAEKIGDRGVILWPLRAALSGKKASSGPFEIAEILGKEKTIKRIKDAICCL